MDVHLKMALVMRLKLKGLRASLGTTRYPLGTFLKLMTTGGRLGFFLNILPSHYLDIKYWWRL